MATLTLNGIDVPVREVSAGRERIVGRARTYLGNAQDGTRDFKRVWRCTTPPLPYLDANAYAGLVQGAGDRVPFTHRQGTRSDLGRGMSGGSGCIVAAPSFSVPGQTGALVMGAGSQSSWAVPLDGPHGFSLILRRLNRARTGVTHIIYGYHPDGTSLYGYKDGVGIAYTREELYDIGGLTRSAFSLNALDRNVGPWVAGQGVSVDQLWVPTVANGWVYRVDVAGTSGTTEPTWPTTYGATVTATSGTAVYRNIGRRGTEWLEVAAVPYWIPNVGSTGGKALAAFAAGNVPGPRPTALGDLISSSGVVVQGTLDGREDEGSGTTLRSTLTFTLREV